eukprot:6208652-Pleurochrysis_carterae.AAC.2
MADPASNVLRKPFTGWPNPAVAGNSSSDPCVFTLSAGDDRLILGCYVDELFILNRDTAKGSLYADFTDALAARWNVEDDGLVSDLLNVEIYRAANYVTL